MKLKVKLFQFNLFIISILVIPNLHAQELKQVLSEMRDQYKDASNLHIEMVIKAYESQDDPQPYFEEHVSIYKMRDNYLVQSGSYDILYNDHYYINLNRQFGQLQCTERDKRDEKEFQLTSIPDLDSLLSFFETPELVSKDADLVHYRVKQKSGDILYADLLIDIKEKKIHELRYYYDPDRYGSDQYASIIFERFLVDAPIDNKIFNESNYVQINDRGGVEPVTAYQGFQVITDNR